MKKETYEVLGMHCVGCSMGIQKLLKKTNGIDDVEVQLIESKLHISYDEYKVNEQVIVDTVARLGYKAVKRT
jgi:P-type Cu+ transporter